MSKLGDESCVLWVFEEKYVVRRRHCSVLWQQQMAGPYQAPLLIMLVIYVINSLVCGRSRHGFKKCIILSYWVNFCYDNALRWMPQDFTDCKSALVQVMAWCCQATSHYLSQCWPSSVSLYCITRPQWVNRLKCEQNGWHFADDFSSTGPAHVK